MVTTQTPRARATHARCPDVRRAVTDFVTASTKATSLSGDPRVDASAPAGHHDHSYGSHTRRPHHGPHPNRSDCLLGAARGRENVARSNAIHRGRRGLGCGDVRDPDPRGGSADARDLTTMAVRGARP